MIRTGEVGGESATGFFKTGSESEAGSLVVDFASETCSTKSVLIFFGDGLLKVSFVSEVPGPGAGSLEPKKLKTDGIGGGILGSVPLAA